MKKIEMVIECQSCKGTGVYQGMAERDGAAVVCHNCNGTGAANYSFSYNEFTGRKTREGVTRVYLNSMGYCIAPHEINFSKIGPIDLSKEGVSYPEFLDGKMPGHIKKLGCPMRADQWACHQIKGFTDKCDELNGGWINSISDCRYYPKRDECWKRFESKKTS